MIVWLASYPRSGNTLVRSTLFHAFGIKSGSIYAEPPGAYPGDEFSLRLVEEDGFDQARRAEEPVFVRTHRVSDPSDPNPAIHIVRDGRDAVVSYAHWVLAQRAPGFEQRSFEQTLQVLIERDSASDEIRGWSANVRSWIEREARTVTIRFEHLIADPVGTTGDAIRRLALPIDQPSGSPPAFEELQRRNPTVFRQGQVGAWRSQMPARLKLRFLELHGEELERLGYAEDEGPADPSPRMIRDASQP